MKTGASIRIMTSKLLSRMKIVINQLKQLKLEREITLTEPLKIIANDSDTRSRKSNQHYTGDKSSNLNDTITSQIKEAQTGKRHLL